ncbi:hypothetical protein BDK51DRAFT_43216 [Blyttiomyces helicus]|uniref:Uncharacterized protein n=1 Tax=Blyttiomyces helicus TaxID=388810 RepID=A0A4P9WHW1_9FUNG|nr:hypothetical protein BDK51DRAFT_43216 [Blyttiomyces helicus]|eukprot:RKO92429.1 hypothetical protein BDK51DRAFT_43216 [Blyttiomyces helicus]
MGTPSKTLGATKKTNDFGICTLWRGIEIPRGGLEEWRKPRSIADANRWAMAICSDLLPIGKLDLLRGLGGACRADAAYLLVASFLDILQLPAGSSTLRMMARPSKRAPGSKKKASDDEWLDAELAKLSNNYTGVNEKGHADFSRQERPPRPDAARSSTRNSNANLAKSISSNLTTGGSSAPSKPDPKRAATKELAGASQPFRDALAKVASLPSGATRSSGVPAAQPEMKQQNTKSSQPSKQPQNTQTTTTALPYRQSRSGDPARGAGAAKAVSTRQSAVAPSSEKTRLAKQSIEIPAPQVLQEGR